MTIFIKWTKGLVWHLSNYHFSGMSESFLHWNGQNKMVNEQFVCIEIWVHDSNLVTLIIIIEKQKIKSNDKTLAAFRILGDFVNLLFVDSNWSLAIHRLLSYLFMIVYEHRCACFTTRDLEEALRFCVCVRTLRFA